MVSATVTHVHLEKCLLKRRERLIIIILIDMPGIRFVVLLQLQLQLQQGLVVRPLQTERWRITLSRGINNKSSIK